MSPSGDLGGRGSPRPSPPRGRGAVDVRRRRGHPRPRAGTGRVEPGVGLSTDTATTASTSATSPGPDFKSKDQLTRVLASAGRSVLLGRHPGPGPGRGHSRRPRDQVPSVPEGVTASSSTPPLPVVTSQAGVAHSGPVAATASGAKSEQLKGGALLVLPAGEETSADFACPNFNPSDPSARPHPRARPRPLSGRVPCGRSRSLLL